MKSRSGLTARLPPVALVLVTSAVAVHFAARAGGTAAGVLASVAATCAVALVLRVEPMSVEAPSAGRLFDGALLALPAALTLYLAFDSGGYFPDGPAFAAIVLTLVLVLRLALVDRPFAGFSLPLAVAAGVLGLYAGWILLSATWSDAFARSLLDFDRALVYCLALVLFGSIPRSSYRLRSMARGLAAGILLVAVAALATRLFPDTFPIEPTVDDRGLGYPLTYANALGILCVLGAILCLHFTASLREPRGVRALAAAAMPVLAVTVYLTLSRGPVFAAAVGLAVYAVLGRPRGLLTGLMAAVPASVLAVLTAYESELVTAANHTTAAAAAQGRHVATILALCALAAGGLRLVLSPLDTRLRRFSLPAHLRRRVMAGAWTVGIAVAVAVALAGGAPAWVADRYDRFVHDEQPAQPGADVRSSVLNTSNRGLTDNWDTALRAFHEQPLHGHGAGTYELFWKKERPVSQVSYDVKDAHSLYLETLGELGVIGFLLLMTAVLAVLASLAPVRRGRNRSLYAALFAAALTWAVHAGVEWNWEMPAVTIWLFAVGGLALARHQRASEDRASSPLSRVAVGLSVLGLAVVPGVILASERQLSSGVQAFERGDCSRAMERARASISTLGARPEPYEVTAYCDVRRGQTRRGLREIEKAVERDPRNWKFRYGLALVRGAAGLDPRPAARAARRLNPRFRLTEELVHELAKGTSRDRQRLATRLARIEGLYAVR